MYNSKNKAYQLAYHWFWDHIGKHDGLVLQKADTSEHLADIATKGPERATFEKDTKNAWIVMFDGAYVLSYPKTNEYWVRCVRSYPESCI